VIIHLDADAFFASVEQAARPRLRGRAMAVGGRHRGIIASASYEARARGVYTPMPTSQALKVCPDLIVVPVDFVRYELFSRFMFGYFHDLSPLVEQASIDEGYCEMIECSQAQVVEAAEWVRSEITRRLKISVSVGVASNKLVAQVASKLRKPKGFVVVEEGGEREFLAPLEIGKLPGLGPKLQAVFHRVGVQTIGQVAEMPEARVRALAGSFAESLKEFSRGIDTRPVVAAHGPAKSFGRQESFAVDTRDPELIRDTLRCLADHGLEDMRAVGACARTVSVKVRTRRMEEKDRSESLDDPSSLAEDFYERIDRLLKKAWDGKTALRMVRVRFSSIYKGWPVRDLLYEAEGRDKRERVQSVIDDLQGRFGKDALMRAHQWKRGRKEDAGGT